MKHGGLFFLMLYFSTGNMSVKVSRSSQATFFRTFGFLIRRCGSS